MTMARSKTGRCKVVHIKINGKRTTASLDVRLADFVCLKLEGKLCNDSGNTLSVWAQKFCDKQNFSLPYGISQRLTYEAINFIASEELTEKWEQAFE